MLTKSKDFLQEYCATVVKIGEIIPIEGSDFLGTTLVNDPAREYGIFIENTLNTAAEADGKWTNEK